MSLLTHIKWDDDGSGTQILDVRQKTGVLNCARGNANADIEHLAGASRVVAMQPL
jgi:hypothetical protein